MKKIVSKWPTTEGDPINKFYSEDAVCDSLVSARSQFDLEDTDDGSMVWGLDAGAVAVFDHFNVVGLSVPEQDPVLWTQTTENLNPAEI